MLLLITISGLASICDSRTIAEAMVSDPDRMPYGVCGTAVDSIDGSSFVLENKTYNTSITRTTCHAESTHDQYKSFTLEFCISNNSLYIAIYWRTVERTNRRNMGLIQRSSRNEEPSSVRISTAALHRTLPIPI
jgi:hypothetical protein